MHEVNERSAWIPAFAHCCPGKNERVMAATHTPHFSPQRRRGRRGRRGHGELRQDRNGFHGASAALCVLCASAVKTAGRNRRGSCKKHVIAGGLRGSPLSEMTTVESPTSENRVFLMPATTWRRCIDSFRTAVGFRGDDKLFAARCSAQGRSSFTAKAPALPPPPCRSPRCPCARATRCAPAPAARRATARCRPSATRCRARGRSVQASRARHWYRPSPPPARRAGACG